MVDIVVVSESLVGVGWCRSLGCVELDDGGTNMVG